MTEAVRLEGRNGEAPVPTAHGYALEAERDWRVLGPPEMLDEIERELPDRACDRVVESCLRLRFGNAVGCFHVPYLGVLQVTSGKWDEQCFERMLADVSAICSALPFAKSDGGAAPYDRALASDRQPLYHAFVYLRHVLSDAAPDDDRLAPALEAILREPHRRLERSSRASPLWRVRQVCPAAVRRLAEGRGTFQRAGGTRHADALVSALDGHLPDSVDERYARSTYDTRENRFVLTFLDQALAVAETVGTELGGERGRAGRIRRDAQRMVSVLESYRRASLWREVGPMVHFPAGSTVLQRRRGYRHVMRHSVRMRMASRIPLDAQQLESLLELKDIAELYELWCYFQVVAVMEDLLGPPLTAESRPVVTTEHVLLPWGFRVAWTNEVEVFYNLSFSRRRSAPRRSTSLPLRPDISLWVPHEDARGFHLFDAKFRLRDLSAAFAEDEGADERNRTFKRDDIYKMHAYRDALPAVRSVRALYPGEHERFFGEDGAALPGLDGVGAVPLEPVADAGGQLRTVLAGLLLSERGGRFAGRAGPEVARC